MKLTLILVLCALILAPVLLLASEEFLTITTYYPSPSGVYNEMTTNYLNFGTDLSTVPVSGADCAKEGQTAYNRSAQKVFLCTGSPLKWKDMGGGAISDVVTASQTNAVSCPTTGNGQVRVCELVKISITPGTWIISSSHNQNGIDYGGACAISHWAIRNIASTDLVGPNIVAPCNTSAFQVNATTVYTATRNEDITLNILAYGPVWPSIPNGTWGEGRGGTLVALKKR